MTEPSDETIDGLREETPLDEQPEVDPEVREVMERLPGYQEYVRELQNERGLTFGDW